MGAEMLDAKKARDVWRKVDVRVNGSGYSSQSNKVLETGVKIARKDGTFSVCCEWI